MTSSLFTNFRRLRISDLRISNFSFHASNLTPIVVKQPKLIALRQNPKFAIRNSKFLLVTQSHQRIDLRRSARWDVASKKGNSSQQDTHD